MKEIIAPGIYRDFDSDAYFADPCPEPSLTQSIAKVLIEKSPAHAALEHPRLHKPKEEDEEPEKYVAAVAIGNAAHAVMIGRGKDIADASFDNWKTKVAQTFRDEALAEKRIPILSKHMDRALAMVKVARATLDASGHADAFRSGDGEVVIAWKEDGMWARSMIDWVVDGATLYDYKTGGLSAAPHAVIERPSLLGWDIQAAMHERGLDALDPPNIGRRKHFYVPQENEPPYALTVIQIGEADLTMGRKKLNFAFAQWAECMRTRNWPSYPSQTLISRPRGWTETQWLNREIENEDRKQRIPSDILAAG